MARKNSPLKKLQELAPFAGGVVASDFVEGLATPYLPANVSKFSNAVPVIAGLFLSNQKGMVGKLGDGLIIGGTSNLIRTLMPGVTGVGQVMDPISGNIDEVVNGMDGDVLGGTDESDYSEEDEL